tara:strand:+ start:223 stop:1377 length:1155 start_codon:yes stop_codon:yes gene_type:complete
MHILESYALSSGAKIDKPYIYGKFYPLPFDKYIVLANFRYKYFQEVIDIIHPKLSEKGIHIVHLSNASHSFKNVYKVSEFDPNQSAYIINRSLGCVGESSFFTDLSSFYNKKTVCLYSNTYIQNVKPYWAKEDELSNIESYKDGKKPSFNTQEDASLINSIKPEQIAKEILEKFNLTFDFQYETLYFGEGYDQNTPVFDVIPDDYPPFILETNEASIRMDLNHDEDFMLRQCQHMTYDIYADKPISREVLLATKHNIREFYYVIKSEDYPDFVSLLTKLAINVTLISFLKEEDLTSKKINYMDYDPILNYQVKEMAEIDQLKGEDCENLFYISNKIIIDKGMLFPSEHAWKNKIAINSSQEIVSFKNDPDLLIDLPFLRVLKRT